MSDSTACNDPQAGTTSSGAYSCDKLPLYTSRPFTMLTPEMAKLAEGFWGDGRGAGCAL